MNKWQVDFHNGSVIRVVASRDISRGKRSTFTIYEEFRLIDKEVLDAVKGNGNVSTVTKYKIENRM